MTVKNTKIVFPAPHRVILETEEAAHQPGPRQVAGHTIYSLVSAGTEVTGLLEGKPAEITFPVYPGYASVFQIDQVGAEVENYKAGDIAFCTGCHQSMQIADEVAVVGLPEGLNPEIAAAARLMNVSMTTLMTTKARPGETVVVSGLGPVGLLAALQFKRAGYVVVGVDPIAGRRAFAAGKGINAPLPVLDPKDLSVFADEPALVVECSGHEDAATAAVRTVRKLGEVVLVGVPWRKRSDVSGFEVLREVFFRYVTLRSGWEWELPLHANHFDDIHTVFGNIARGMEWLNDGSINVEGLYEIVPVSSAPEVYSDILKRRRTALLTVFDWRNM